MRRPVALIAIALATLVAAVTVPSAASAASTKPRATISPGTGLIDGQAVAVSASGFQPGGVTAFLECDPSIGPHPDLAHVNQHCGIRSSLIVDDNGDVEPTTASLAASVALIVGGTLDCASQDCNALVGELGNVNGKTDFTTAGRRIHFGLAVPVSRLDCVHGAWQHSVNKRGKPFHSAAQCLTFLRRHPPKG